MLQSEKLKDSKSFKNLFLKFTRERLSGKSYLYFKDKIKWEYWFYSEEKIVEINLPSQVETL